MIRRIYIAGPMSGHPEFNFPAFRAAAAFLRERGHEVVSPHEVGEALGGPDCGLTAAQFLAADIRHLIECEAVALLPGWERSIGARCEAAIAVTLGFPFYCGITGEPLDTPAEIRIDRGYPRGAA